MEDEFVGADAESTMSVASLRSAQRNRAIAALKGAKLLRIVPQKVKLVLIVNVSTPALPAASARASTQDTSAPEIQEFVSPAPIALSVRPRNSAISLRGIRTKKPTIPPVDFA